MCTVLGTCRQFVLSFVIASLLPLTANAVSYIGIDLYALQTPNGLTRISLQDAAGGQAVGWAAPVGDNFHALLWPGPAGAALDLSPVGFTTSQTKALNGSQQVGFGTSSTDGNTHALLWSGTAASAIDLNPTGFTRSHALAIGGGQEVGDASGISTNDIAHAMLWTGTAASAIDLNPSGFTFSHANAASGGQQVGGASADGNSHAMLWTGTAASAVDLNPAGATSSFALGVGGGQQVGDVNFPLFSTHAALWTGTAASAVDLNPTGSILSEATAVSGGIQVGYAQVNGGLGDAYLWTGTAASAVDLALLLPAADRSFSAALSIDSSGNVFGYAQDSSGKVHAVEWSPVPEPSAAILAALGLVFVASRPRQASMINAL